MVRPAKWRCLECRPGTQVFGPAGVPAGELDVVRLPFDVLEALRLLHLEDATQEEAGRRLGVSQSTVSRMAQQGHRALTEALVHGKALCVEGGPVTVVRVNTTIATDMRQGEKMIIAVPYLQGHVNAHFGSTQEFLIAEVVDDRVTETSVYEIQGMQHSHSGIAGFLRDQGVQVILAGGMGAPMQQALKRTGFELCCGVSGPAVEAVEAFLRGDIEHSEATCGHHHGEHHEE